jgi:hypothetical protein
MLPLVLFLIATPAEAVVIVWHYSGYRKNGRYNT